ncbi:MAG TPA: hypothetical protein VMF68_09425 [Spirochaetia bacterium]|nr:hypothetical protein [Spirochaetia bacterium]
MKAMALVIVLLGVVVLPLTAEEQREPPFLQVMPRIEIGTLAVLSHQYQSGSGGTMFDFVRQGGQDILFPYERYSVELILAGRHRLSFLYQPLTLDTRTVVGRNGTASAPIVVDSVSFPLGSQLDLTYGFDFWRVSYVYDFVSSGSTTVGAGASLQIRNASIVFSQADGSGRAVQQNIGPVPILKLRASHWFSPAFGLDLDADGFYASSALFNGATRPFEGWIWDVSVSAKAHVVAGITGFLTVRSIGGGARGDNAYDTTTSTTSSPGSYTFNSLATLAVTLGASIQ